MLDDVNLAGVPIRDTDVLEVAVLLRAGGFEDVAHKLDHARLIRTEVLALRSSTASRCSGLSTIRRPMRSPSSGRCFSSSTSGGCAKGSCRSTACRVVDWGEPAL